MFFFRFMMDPRKKKPAEQIGYEKEKTTTESFPQNNNTTKKEKNVSLSI